MPIYNVAPYLEIALNSVANQTHKNLEILMVDDVSDDGSEVIMAAYAEKDPRFRHIRLTTNGGSGAARNLAIAQARGSYLGFLDGDDVFTPHAIARLLTSLEATGADLAVGHVMRNRGGELVSSRLHREYFATKRLRTSIVELPELVYDTTVWNKLFRTSFWRDNTLAFPEGVLYQDMVVMADAYALN
ncbi:MAG: putative CDP-glycerol--polyglycerol phosphate glycero-phosphotransferase, partial [Nocardioidaceae bacterium]|nr:putative CDP-glycerol--polyglycerol phosphate glycero-phosphotransferase [Nocardioidaceae bacterium]